MTTVRGVVRDETKHLVAKDDLVATEQRLARKIEDETAKLAQITVREFRRTNCRTEAPARHERKRVVQWAIGVES